MDEITALRQEVSALIDRARELRDKTDRERAAARHLSLAVTKLEEARHRLLEAEGVI